MDIFKNRRGSMAVHEGWKRRSLGFVVGHKKLGTSLLAEEGCQREVGVLCKST
jgi:hypothetical protein